MEPMEVIDLSSDDEKSPLQVTKKGVMRSEETKPSTLKKNNNNKSKDVEIVYNVPSEKRIMKSSDDSCLTKKLKLSNDDKTSRCAVVKSEFHFKNLSSSSKTNGNRSSSRRSDKLPRETSSPRFPPGPSVSETMRTVDGKSSSDTEINRSSVCLDGSKLHTEDKQMASSAGQSSRSVEGESSTTVNRMRPQLVVKSRIKVSESGEVLAPIKEMFQSFLDACLQRDSSNDMKEILRRLKRIFDNLEPGFAKSESFMHMIRNKRDLISKDGSDIYRHMLEIKYEMKARQIRHNPVIQYENESEYLTTLRTHENPNEQAVTNEDSKESQQLRLLEKAMRRCQRYINKCETAEVDFDNENDSHYIMAEKYKYRMIELYNKYCEITGERPDAARPYLRPKNFTVTPLPLLNNAIASFVNMKITKMNHLSCAKKGTRRISFAEAIIFPDYIDILNCVKKCNIEQNLQLSQAKEKEIAKRAFTELGEHLQHCRQRDYYDTFSLYLEEGPQDPASGDESLAAKLRENDEIGKKKMKAVLEEFVVKQNTIGENGAASNTTKESQDDQSDESSNDTDCHSEDSESKSGLASPKLDSASIENEIRNSSKRLQSDSELDTKDYVQPDIHSEKNDATETNKEASTRTPDEEISIPSKKSMDEKKCANTSQLSGDESIENVQTLLAKTTTTSNNEKCVPSLPILTPIQKPSSARVPRKEIAMQTSKQSDVNVASDDLLSILAKNTEVTVIPAVAATVKTIDEKMPILRPRSFAKPPAHWKDCQSVSTSGSIANTAISETAERETVVKKEVKLSSAKLEQNKLRKSDSLSSLRKTVLVKTDLVNDSKVKIKTLTVPSDVVNKIIKSKVSVQSVTNNITVVNIGDQSNFKPTITSVVSCKTKFPTAVRRCGEDGALANQYDKRVTNVTSNRDQTSEKADVVRIAKGNNQHIFSLKKPAINQCSVNSKEAARALPQQYKIISPKNMSGQKQIGNIRTLPVRDENGKPIVYKMVKSPVTASRVQRVIIPRTVVHSQTLSGQNHRSNCNLTPIVDTELKFRVPQIINTKPLQTRIPRSSTNSTNGVRDAPVDSVPTYMIE